jgi:hypothetical protein
MKLNDLAGRCVGVCGEEGESGEGALMSGVDFVDFLQIPQIFFVVSNILGRCAEISGVSC